MIDAVKSRRSKRIAWVIQAVCRRVKLQAFAMMGPQNPRDAKGTQARYAVWWVLYFRFGMTQAGIARVWRISPEGVATGVRRVEELVEDSLVMCQAMEAAEQAATSGHKRWPLEDHETERVARMLPPDWRGDKKEFSKKKRCVGPKRYRENTMGPERGGE